MAEPSSPRFASDFTAYGLIPQLPDDLSVQIIARLPRSSHPILALVSRSWRFFLCSPLLFTLRSQLGATEPSLCVNIHLLSGQSRWFFLNLHPCRLLPLPPPPFPKYVSACVTIGPSLFVFGGSIRGAPSHAVQVFDARLGTWTTLPPMGVSRQHPAVGAIGGRIYVLGGCLPSSDSWAEVLEPTSGRWAPVPSPPHLRSKMMCGSTVVGDRLVVTSEKGGLGFDPAASLPWEDAMPGLWEDGFGRHVAAVDGVIYRYRGRYISGYDTTAEKADEKLKRVDGLDGELPDSRCGVTMASMGGWLCLVWRNWKIESKEMEIECAGIKVTRRSGVGLWGSVVWRESSPTPISDGSWVDHCLTLEF